MGRCSRQGQGCTRVTAVGVGLGGTLGDLQSALGGDLVEGEFAAAEDFAGIAMAV